MTATTITDHDRNQLSVTYSPSVHVARAQRGPTRSAWSPLHLLRQAAGLDEALLDAFPGDRRYYTTQLVCVLLVALMAITSMTTTLTMTTGQDAWGWPIVFGFGLGVLIVAVDLSITLPDAQPHRRSRALSYGARLGFALVAGVLVAMPLTARIMASDVDRHERQVRDQIIEEARKGHDAQVSAVRMATHEQHAAEIAAATTARTATQAALDQASTAADGQRSACNAEIDGVGGSGIAGEGPRAGAKCSAAAQLADQARIAGSRLDEVEATLRSAIQADVAAQDTQAAAVPSPKIEPFDPAELGVLDRIDLTHQRLGTVGTIGVTVFLVFVDCLPLSLKLARGRSRYELVLERRHDRALREMWIPDPVAGSELDVASLLEEGIPAEVELEPLDDWLRRRLAEEPDIPATRLFPGAQQHGFERSYETFVRELRRRRGPRGTRRRVASS